MGCGCGGRGISKQRSRSGRPPQRGLVAGRRIGSNGRPRRDPQELRELAAKTEVQKSLTNNSKSSGGLTKERREIEKKRRLAILRKLGKL